MMGLWVAAGKPRYKYDEPSTVYISNVAGVHKVGWARGARCEHSERRAPGKVNAESQERRDGEGCRVSRRVF